VRSRLHRIVGPLVSLAIFALAATVLYRLTRHFSLHELVTELRTVPTPRVLLALAATALGYAALTGYEFLAFRQLRLVVKPARVALAAFLAYAFGNSISYSLLTGTPIRYRLYSSQGLSAVDITRIVALCFLGFWIGMLALGGIALTLEPPPLPAELPGPPGSVRGLGVLAVGVALAYLAVVLRRRGPVHFRGWSFELPRPAIALGQLAVAVADWTLAAAALYVLLPPATELGFVPLLGMFLLAQMGGMVSQVPGGLGVFETLMTLQLSGHVEAPAVLGALVLFRLVYYVLPLGLAAGYLTISEAVQRRRMIGRAARTIGRWAPDVTPQVLAILALGAGALLLASGTLPAVTGRLRILHRTLGLPVIEVSHFLGSLAGMGLVLLGRGIQRRLDAAWVAAVVALSAGIVLALLRGLDWEEASVLLVVLLLFLASRRAFHRVSALGRAGLTPGWIALSGIVLVATTWLVMFSYRHVEYSSDLWWKFTLFGDAPRALRAMVGATALAVLLGTLFLLRTAPPDPALPDEAEIERAARIARESPDSSAHLAMLGDKRFLFNEAGTAFLMYGVEGRSWISMGDPVGPVEDRVELCWRFRELVDRHDGWTVFYEIRPASLGLYVDVGLTLYKVGETARVPLGDFTLEGHERKDLRQAYRRGERDGCRFRVVPREGVPPLLPELRVISDAWLSQKQGREKGFSLGAFREDYLSRTPVAVVECDGRIVAFANLWPGGDREELSVDLMRYAPEAAPRGVMDYLFVHLMLWGQENGYAWFSLGMAPLAGLEDHARAPLWSRLGALLFRYGEHFYSFQGLREFKDKFRPVWEPRYVACPGGLALPVVLTNIASLVAGGPEGLVTR